MIHIILAAFGLSTILAKSIVVFNLIKWSGAVYLVYMGVKLLLDKSNLFNDSKMEFETRNLTKIYSQGLLTNVLNPKVAIFFMSLLPQFIKPEFANSPTPFLILGLTFLATGVVWCMILAYSASYMTKTLRQNNKIGKVMKKISALVFVALGLQLILKKS